MSDINTMQQIGQFWFEIKTPYGVITKHHMIDGKIPRPNEENVKNYLQDIFNIAYNKALVELNSLIKKNTEVDVFKED